MSDQEKPAVGSSFGDEMRRYQATQNAQASTPVAVTQQVQSEAHKSAPVAQEAAPAQAQETSSFKLSEDPFKDFFGQETEEAAPTQTDEVDFSEFDKSFPDEPDDIKNDPKAKARWKEIKQTAKAEKLRAYQYERSLAKKDQEIEALKKSATVEDGGYKDKYEKILQSNAILALQEDSDFQNNIGLPYQQATQTINDIMQAFSIPKDKLGEAMNSKTRPERNRKLSEVLAETEMDDFSKQDFLKAISDWESLNPKYVEAHERAQELYEASKQKRAQVENQSYEQRANLLKEKSSEVLKAMESRPYFKDIFPDSIQAEEFKSRVASSLNSEPSPEMAVFEKASSFALLPTINALIEAKKEIKSLTEALKKHESGGAALGSGGHSSAVVDNKPKKVGEDFASAMRDAASRGQLRM